MGWSFRRRIKVIPGVYLNVSRRGVSATVGVRGASLTFRGDGTYANVGIPGTGVYGRQKISAKVPRPSSGRFLSHPQAGSAHPSAPNNVPQEADQYFVSSDPLEIASPDLQGLQSAVIAANRQKGALRADIKLIYDSIERTHLLTRLAKSCLLYYCVPPLRHYLLNLVAAKQRAAKEVESSLLSSSVPLGIAMDADIENAYKALKVAFKALTLSHSIWDVTSGSDVDQIKLRSVASSSVTRAWTSFSFSHVPGIESEFPAFHLVNANGADIYIYPGFFVMYENPERLGIVELAKLRVFFERTGFLEEEQLPKDSKKVSEVWERANKDGTRDRRFSNNRLLPVMEYGQITFKSDTGVYEKYLISHCQHAADFVDRLGQFISLLPA